MTVQTIAAVRVAAQQPLPPLARPGSANEDRYIVPLQQDCGTEAPASSFGPGDEMNVAVRMVVPLRREFGRVLDVSHFLHDAACAWGIIDLAKSSRDARPRGHAAFLDRQWGSAAAAAPVRPAPSVVAPVPAPVPLPVLASSAAAVLPAMDFTAIKWRSARHVMALLGPTADALCLKIEGSATMDEFVAQARRAHGVVRDIRVAARADDFGDLVEGLIGQLPPQLD